MSTATVGTRLASPVATAIGGVIDTSAAAPSVLRRVLVEEPEQDYYLYVPTRGGQGAPILVAVHGISRNAREQAAAFAPFAERYGVVVVAPVFSAERFPAYQRLGIDRDIRRSRPDVALDGILAEVGDLTGARTERVHLFGYSGGGQFVHRYAMAYPDRVQAAALGAPGWFTFPDERLPFPRGLRLTSSTSRILFRPERFLRVPMAVLVGAQDNQRDAAFNTARRIDEQQGRTRIERGYRWVTTMCAAAAAWGYPPRYEYRSLSSCGHSFGECLGRGLGEEVFEFLFGRLDLAWMGDRRRCGGAESPFLVFRAP